MLAKENLEQGENWDNSKPMKKRIKMQKKKSHLSRVFNEAFSGEDVAFLLAHKLGIFDFSTQFALKINN